MRKYIFSLSCLVLLFVFSAHSQFTSIKGSVTDTIDKKNLSDAVVAVLGKKDSVLIRFARTNKSGEFLIKQVPQDSLIVQITHPDFADYVDVLKPGTEMLDLGSIQMTPKGKLLEEVFVRGNKAIVIKGDTIEYKADSFKVQDGANVKELLKRMPGLQVDRNGQVTAQGKKVEKVLVDGEEFFSDDPAVVIENLRADAIDKVQSFDKKSDQAEFTGVDDGTRSKTLNLVLKEDKKKGLLGKVVIGGGTFERYSSQAMLNFFKGKKKLSVYGIGSNTGVTGLGWDDRNKFSQGFDLDEAEVLGNMIMISGSDNDFDDWNSSYYDEGIPRTIKAGAHFSNKWNRDRQNMNGNYSVKNINVNANGNSLTKYILPDSAYYSRESHNSSSRQTEQLFNGMYDVKLDSFASLRFKMNGKLENSDKRTFTSTESTDDELQAVNRNNRTNTLKQDAGIFLGSVLWRQKFKKKGRTLSFTASYKRTSRDSKGFLYSETDFFDLNGFPNQRDTIDQYKVNTSTSNAVTSKLVYTEPAGKKGIIEFNYVFNRTATVSDRKSFDKVNDKYSALNDLFSIRYGLNYFTNNGGVKYQYNDKKVTASFGTNVGVSNYIQNDSSGKKILSFQYVNLFPTSRFMYKFSAQRNLSLSYNGSPSPPGIDQIQPILENTNPLYITIGNPELKQSYNHNFSLFYNDYKVLTGRSIWINGSFNPVQNSIVTSQNTDVEGKTTMQYINTKGNYNYYFSGSYGFKLKGDIYTGFDLRTDGGRYVNFVNDVKNVNNRNSVSLGSNIGKYKENKFDVNVNLSFGYNFSSSSISTLKSNFWKQEHNGRFNYYFSKKFQVGTEINLYLREKNDAFTGDNNIAVWDASVSYKIFKKNNGVIKLEVNDILKERRGYDRSFTSNYIYERNYNMLGRYGMLSFTWNFTKSPGTAGPAATK